MKPAGMGSSTETGYAQYPDDADEPGMELIAKKLSKQADISLLCSFPSSKLRV